MHGSGEQADFLRNYRAQFSLRERFAKIHAQLGRVHPPPDPTTLSGPINSTISEALGEIARVVPVSEFKAISRARFLPREELFANQEWMAEISPSSLSRSPSFKPPVEPHLDGEIVE
jgi:hypothetical protein